jgi:hypothetical protein
MGFDTLNKPTLQHLFWTHPSPTVPFLLPFYAVRRCVLCAVDRVSNVYTDGVGFAYDVQFGRLMGDVPLLRVTNTSGLLGTSANVSVGLVQQGSTNIFLGPIPAQLLSQPVPNPDAISLAVNDVVATCRATAGCRFSHSAAATPTITAVTPASISPIGSSAQVCGC